MCETKFVANDTNFYDTSRELSSMTFANLCWFSFYFISFNLELWACRRSCETSFAYLVALLRLRILSWLNLISKLSRSNLALSFCSKLYINQLIMLIELRAYVKSSRNSLFAMFSQLAFVAQILLFEFWLLSQLENS